MTVREVIEDIRKENDGLRETIKTLQKDIKDITDEKNRIARELASLKFLLHEENAVIVEIPEPEVEKIEETRNDLEFDSSDCVEEPVEAKPIKKRRRKVVK